MIASGLIGRSDLVFQLIVATYTQKGEGVYT